ncbi:MAG: protein-disulfide reductase DsbD N-terminal domain-containing protein [Gammaproteobacteria bacterium]
MDKRFHAFLIIVLAAAAVPGAPSRAATFAERLRGLAGGGDGSGSGEFLPADQAFRFTASVAGPRRLSLMWEIADGYYLYRNRFSFAIVKGGARIRQDRVNVPTGTVEHDQSFGDIEINTGDLAVDLPVRRDGAGAAPIVLRVRYQGCKKNTICYPPITKDIALTLPPARAPQ